MPASDPVYAALDDPLRLEALPAVLPLRNVRSRAAVVSAAMRADHEPCASHAGFRLLQTDTYASTYPRCGNALPYAVVGQNLLVPDA